MPAGYRYLAPKTPGQRHKHETNGTSSYHKHMLPRSQLTVFNSQYHAGQRFHERGIGKVRLRSESQKIFFDDPGRYNNRFSVRSIQEH